MPDEDFDITGFSSDTSDFSETEYRENQIRDLYGTDRGFYTFIKTQYGTYENYIQQIANKRAQSNLMYEFFVPIKVIEEDDTYTTDHISGDGIINQLQLGVCAITTKKVSGTVKTFFATLKANLIPESKQQQRIMFFGQLSYGRIGFWDTIKQNWASIYPQNMIQFVRDETSTIE